MSNAKTCAFPRGQGRKCECRQMKTNAWFNIQKGNAEKEKFIGNVYWDEDKKSVIGFSEQVKS